MALPDDLNQLAQEDVVYLTQVLSASTVITGASTSIFRGRLHQALSGNWVFNTSTGQNGVAGINLGPSGTNWASSSTPAGGLSVTILNQVLDQLSPGLILYETITLTNVIPQDLAD